MAEPSGAERRQYKRRYIQFPVRYRLNIEGVIRDWRESEAGNISAGGVFVTTEVADHRRQDNEVALLERLVIGADVRRAACRRGPEAAPAVITLPRCASWCCRAASQTLVPRRVGARLGGDGRRREGRATIVAEPRASGVLVSAGWAAHMR